MSDTVRVLIADDHPLYRVGLRDTLLASGGFDVVAEAATGEEAVAAAASTRPAVAVMDINMPGMNGVEATRLLVGQDPDIGVLMLTMFRDDDSVFAAMRAGARGYLLKDAEADEIAQAVRTVATGGAVFGAGVAERMLAYLGVPPADLAGTGQAFPELSEREREVLELMAAGLKNPAIAERLYLSPKTVRNLVSSVFAKLQVADRTQAILRPRRAGFGDPPPS